MKIDYSKRFIKHLKKASRKIKISFRERLNIFVFDKSERILENHKLKGKWKGFRSINVTGDWRAVYHELGGGKIEWVEFVEIGTHSELYR